MDYEVLDYILDYLKKAKGYSGWIPFHTYVCKRDTFPKGQSLSDYSYAGWCNTLLHWGLVDYKFSGNDGHTYIINPKGLDLLDSKKSTRKLHEEFKRREQLEDRILQGTIESHEIGKSATKLNGIQLAVTIILGLLTLFSFYFQNEANQIATRSLEIAEKAHQLELDNKKTIDSVVVIMSSQNQVKKLK